jgi:16S rRNA (cytidine1402-2'-O)-methyltransferase
MSEKGKLYLIPVELGDGNIEDVIPTKNITIIKSLNFFIVENAKEARAFLKKSGYPFISEAILSLTNKHTVQSELEDFLKPAVEGYNIGLMSDAGCPGIADPGAEIVNLAHQKGIQVIPLVGPSSIVLSIMASGFNGQNFAFNGYLPIDKPEKIKKIKDLESFSIKNNQAQYFIETPYRNAQLFDDLLKTLHPNTKLLVATNLTLNEEDIQVNTISTWKKKSPPDFFKKPTVFGFFSC